MARLEEFCDFVRDVLSCINRGYYYSHLSRIPLHKLDRAPKIHAKIAAKYPIFSDRRGKYHRHMRKHKGLCNYLLKTYEDIILLLRTSGNVDVPEDDHFTDIRSGAKLVLNYPGDGAILGFRIVWNGDRADAYLTRECYRFWRTTIEEAVTKKWDVERYLRTIECLPNFRGVNEQLQTLRLWIQRRYKVRLRKLRLKRVRALKKAQTSPNIL